MTILDPMRKRTSEAFASAGFGETRQEAAPRGCDAPGCAAEGCYPAPRDRARPRPYLYFCLDHVRAYNAGWDYYRGMTASEIDADRRLDVVWRRPTWALGGDPRRRATAEFVFDDPLGAFTDVADDGGETPSRPRARRYPPASAEARAQRAMDLGDDFDLSELKMRYKVLVKRWHPDANGGSPEAEERLKAINDAYRTLKRALGA
ncbi:MAG: J domain-containing protein [Alphaproteobacteria bacterium]